MLSQNRAVMDQNQMCVLNDGTKLYHYSFETVCNKMSSKGYTRPNELFDIVAGQYEGRYKLTSSFLMHGFAFRRIEGLGRFHRFM